MFLDPPKIWNRSFFSKLLFKHPKLIQGYCNYTTGQHVAAI